MELQVVDIGSYGLESISSIIFNSTGHSCALLGRNGPGVLLLFDSSFESPLLKIETDATSSVFSASGNALLLDGRPPTLLQRDAVSGDWHVTKLANISSMEFGAFANNDREAVVVTDDLEIVSFSVSVPRVEKKRIQLPQGSCVHQIWMSHGEVYFSYSSDACRTFSVMCLSNAHRLISTQRYRNPPQFIGLEWKAIVNSGVFHEDARIEDVLTKETIAYFPCEEDFICRVSLGSHGVRVLHENVATRSWHDRRRVAVWDLNAGQYICDFDVGIGRSCLCQSDMALALTEFGENETRLSIRSIDNFYEADQIRLPKTYPQLSCPFGDETLLLLDSQIDDATKLFFVRF